MTDFRVALVGYGLAGACFHAPLIAVTRGLRLALVVTRDAQRAARARAAHPGVEVVPSVDDLWRHGAAPEVVVVASPNRTHVPVALAAVEAGAHVVVDKPLAATAGQAHPLVSLAEARGRVVTVFQNRRWDGDYLTVRRLLRDGALGEPLRFESRFERWRPLPKTGWRELGDPEEAGGILYDLGSHLVDQALQLFGPVVRVYAELDRRRPGVVVDDDAFVALTHASGVRSHLHMSAVAAQLGPRFRLLGSRAAYTKHGTDVQEAALRAGARPHDDSWGAEPPDQWGHLGAGDDVRPVPTERGRYQAFYEGLVQSLRGAAAPPVDVRDALAALTVLEAARRSAEEGRELAMTT